MNRSLIGPPDGHPAFNFENIAKTSAARETRPLRRTLVEQLLGWVLPARF